MAIGFEDRLEQQRNQRDPLQLGASGVWESGNFSQFAGQYNVQEGFLELNVPVLKTSSSTPWSSMPRAASPAIPPATGGNLETGRPQPAQ